VTGSITEVGGVIIAATITNPGNLSNALATASITTSTGSGATIRVQVNPSGSFTVNGAVTADMIYYAQDCAASKTDIAICGFMATNDVTNNVTSVATCESVYASVIANLKTIYATLLAAGKKIVICPDLPRYGNTAIQNACLAAIGNWQRKFAASFPTYNATNQSQVVIADPTPYLADGTLANLGQPIGGNGALAGAMTADGLHPSPRGAQYIAQTLLVAMSRWIGSGEIISAREANATGGFDRVMNPDGNMVEAFPWQASTAYALNQTCQNGVNVYYCSQAGTSAASGGPTGTGSGITDNTAKWGYARLQGCSVFAGTSTALATPPSGITYSGNYPLGMVLSRVSGSASGTVTGAIENPWSTGQLGQRWSLAFSVGSGTDREEWQAYLNNFGLQYFGIEPADEGTAQVYALAEVEVTSAANLSFLRLYWGDSGAGSVGTECGYSGTTTSGTHTTEAASSGEMITMPTRRLLRTPPLLVTQAMGGNSYLGLYIQFDASGGAGSATGTVKFNFLGLYRADVN
jgi:lysophospholipase L1-like esterase